MLLNSSAVVRSATEEDLMLVAEWIESPRDCEFWAGNALSYPLQLDTLAQDISLSALTSFCLVDPRVLAFGQLIDKGSGRVHLAKIIVATDQRGAGIGSFIIAELLKIAGQKPFSVVGLNVQPDNEVAISLYKKLGFEFTERPANVTPSSTSLYMAKWL